MHFHSITKDVMLTIFELFVFFLYSASHVIVILVKPKFETYAFLPMLRSLIPSLASTFIAAVILSSF